MADDAYIRESILNPNAKIVAGFQPNVMPVFDGQITEEGIVEVIAYIKSLSPECASVTTRQSTVAYCDCAPRAERQVAKDWRC